MFVTLLGFAYAGNDDSKGKNSDANSEALVSVTGKVVDFISGEALTGVEISIEGTDQKVYSDFDGNFKFDNLDKGEYNMVASFISYENSLIENLDTNQNKIVSIKMKTD